VRWGKKRLCWIGVGVGDGHGLTAYGLVVAGKVEYSALKVFTKRFS
jgi:hypothetical protein